MIEPTYTVFQWDGSDIEGVIDFLKPLNLDSAVIMEDGSLNIMAWNNRPAITARKNDYLAINHAGKFYVIHEADFDLNYEEVVDES